MSLPEFRRSHINQFLTTLRTVSCNKNNTTAVQVLLIIPKATCVEFCVRIVITGNTRKTILMAHEKVKANAEFESQEEVKEMQS